MKIALISAIRRTESGILLAEQTLAGRIVLAWQVDNALELGCERILCLCDSLCDAAIAQQRRVEGEGLGFHMVRGPLQLAGLVRPEDQLVIQLDGLLLGSEQLRQMEAGGESGIDSSHKPIPNAIWTIGANHQLSAAYPEDFERIDQARHWAGLAIIPGECAAGLEQMPADADTVSLLLRLALQARTPCKSVPVQMLEGNQWLLADDEQVLERRGAALIENKLPDASWSAPSLGVARAVVRATARRWLGKGSEWSGSLGIGIMGVGALVGALGHAPLGLSMASLGAFVVTLGLMAGAMRSGLSGKAPNPGFQSLFERGIVLLAATALIGAYDQGAYEVGDWVLRVSVPCLAVALARLASIEATSKIRPFWRDVSLHLALFAIAVSFGALEPAMLVFSMAALFLLMHRKSKR